VNQITTKLWARTAK